MTKSKQYRRREKAKRKAKKSQSQIVDSPEALALPDRYAAGATVAGITELLEAILVQLDVKTLLLAQRVNRTFKNVIRGSDKIQKKLFFKPATIEEAVKLNNIRGQHYLAFIQRRALDSLPISFYMSIRKGRPWKPRPCPKSDLYLLNPLLFYNLNAMDSRPFLRTWKLRTSKKHNGITESWRHMHLAHPFAPQLEGSLYSKDMGTLHTHLTFPQPRGGEVVNTWTARAEADTLERHGSRLIWSSSAVCTYRRHGIGGGPYGVLLLDPETELPIIRQTKD